MMETDIDLILPVYNPDEGWELTVVSKYKELEVLWKHADIHLYVVNDGSARGFDKVVTDYIRQNIPEVHILSYSINHGKGFALRKAVSACNSDYILYTDHDFPYTLDSMSRVLEMLQRGVDVVVSTRDKAYYDCLPFSRRLISRFVRGCNRYLLQMNYSDTQAGLKGFSRKGRTVFLSTCINTYLFDLEFVYKACHHPDLIMEEVPVKLREAVCFSVFGFEICWKELLRSLYMKSSERWKYKFGVLPKK